jgi:hypothetical protein
MLFQPIAAQRLAAQLVPRLPSRSMRVPGSFGNLHDYEAMGAMSIGGFPMRSIREWGPLGHLCSSRIILPETSSKHDALPLAALGQIVCSRGLGGNIIFSNLASMVQNYFVRISPARL